VYFEHRVAHFIKLHKFKGRSGLYIDDQKKVLISATAIMLTFGYRDFLLNSLERILIYPGSFYSRFNKAQHKGEFNPAYKAIVLSWEDFMHGYSIENDNFNLGIHEMVHAMHFDFLRSGNNSISALLFTRYYDKLKRFLKTNKAYRQNLVNSKYLRNYAFTNRFEFIAVLIEYFFETPKELKSEFPEIYTYVKKMLNFEVPLK
jgi:Mlc titration factor MtfA (ptsG expression regulator)